MVNIGSAPTREALDTVNLVFLREGAGKAQWLFPDSSQTITSLQPLSTSHTTLALLLETTPRPQAGQDLKPPATPTVDLHLVSPDGLRHHRLLQGLERVLSQRLHGHTLHLVYQQGQAVKFMRVALPGFEVRSEQVVATLKDTP